MSVLDIYRQVMLAGVIQPLQANLNFASGFTIVANPTLNSLDVSVTGGGGGISALTGDVTASGSGSVAATVARINGATVPAAGALTTGNGPYVSGASALTYSALNLAGGSGWVTGLLPVANFAPGTSGQVFVSNATPNAVWTSLISYETTHGRFTAGGGGTDFGATIGPGVTHSTAISGLWLLANGVAPTDNNATLIWDGTYTYMAGGSNSGYLFGTGGYSATSIWMWSGATFTGFGGFPTPALSINYSTTATPYLQSGTSATQLTIGTNKSAATLILQYGAAVTGLTLGGNGIAPGVGTQSLAAGGSITPSAAVLANPYITLTGSLPGNTTVVLPNAVGMWWFDISGVTFSGHTLAFSSGSTTSATISSLVTTTEIVQVFCGGGNTISMNS